MPVVISLLVTGVIIALAAAVWGHLRPVRITPTAPAPPPKPRGFTQKQEFLLIGLAAAIGAALVGRAVFGSWGLGLLFSLVGVGAPGWLVRRRQEYYNARVAEQLESLMSRLAGTMGSGTTPEMAWFEAAAEVPAPLGTHLVDVANELRVGRTLDEALGARAHYLGLPEFHLIATATAVLSGMGGNLAEAYRRVADTIAQRRSDKAVLQSITAETRMNGHIVALTPFIAFGAFRAMVPEYVAPILASTGGLLILGIGVGLVFAGWVWMMRIASAERLD